MSLRGPKLTAKPRRSLRLNHSANDECSLDDNAENIHPEPQSESDQTKKRYTTLSRTPLTPVQSSLVNSLRQRLEQQLSGKLQHMDSAASVGEPRTSPGLVNLRMTPGRKLREKQNILLEKHDEARNRAGKTCVGGGISIWPEMQNMRLTSKEIRGLLVSSVTLIVSVVYMFSTLHGALMIDLGKYLQKLKTFAAKNPLNLLGTQESFNSSLLHWHTSFTSLLDEVVLHVEVSLPRASYGYQVYVLVYAAGTLTLLYYLADNVLATNKLTPRRIKIWVSLLVVMGTWTFLMLQLLVLAQAVEASIETNIHWLNGQLSDLLYLSLDLTTYRDVRTFWHTRCLPPTTTGTLSLFGLVAIRDVSYYLQYYSLPILTALLMPVGKLIQALKQVYTVKVHA